MLVGGKSTNDGWVVIGVNDRGAGSHVVCASDCPAVKIAQGIPSLSKVWSLDLEGLIVQPDLADVAVNLK